MQYDDLFDVSKGCGDDIPPYLLGDHGCFSSIRLWHLSKKKKFTQTWNFFTIEKINVVNLLLRMHFGILKNFCCFASSIWMLFLFSTSSFFCVSRHVKKWEWN